MSTVIMAYLHPHEGGIHDFCWTPGGFVAGLGGPLVVSCVVVVCSLRGPGGSSWVVVMVVMVVMVVVVMVS